MDTYADRLKTAMQAAGVSVAQLAAAVGVTYQGVKKVLDGGAFGSGNNAKAAAYLSVGGDWLATGKGDHRAVIGTELRTGVEHVAFEIAEHFFLQPPALLQGHEGLDGLLDEAYLAHRLVEEVNDLYIKHFGQPLIPVDITVANVIAHQLIGEAFANQLDEAVHHAVDEMLNEDSFALESVETYREQLKSPETEAAWKRWPCLSRQLGVELELDQPAA